MLPLCRTPLLIKLVEPGSEPASAHAARLLAGAKCLFHVRGHCMATFASLLKKLEFGTASLPNVMIQRFHSTWLEPGPPSCIWDPASMYKWFGPPASVGDLALIRDLASIRIYIIAYYDRPCMSQQHIAVGAVLLNTALVAQTALVAESVLKARSYCVVWTSPMISNNLGAVSQFPT